MSDSMQTLIHAYLDESLTAEQFRELQTWINADPANAKQFAQQVYLDERLHAEISWQQFSEDESKPNEFTSVKTRPESVSLSTPSPAKPERRWAWIATVAAGLLLALSWALWSDAPLPNGRDIAEKGDSTRPLLVESSDAEIQDNAVATLAQIRDAVWEPISDSDGDVDRREGDRLGVETLRLRSGIVHLEFDSGVEVILEGPASYDIQTMDETRLAYGLLTATVPPGAEGFRVDTPSAQVIDLGTAFGIELDRDGLSKVSVFDGEVEVVPEGQTTKRLLIEGESIELQSDGSMNDIAFEPRRFERLWPMVSGIVKSSGAFRFAPPWPRQVKRLQNDEHVFVLPEGYATRLVAPCAIDFSEPGLYENESQLSPSEIPTDQRVRSFLLVFNPVPPKSTDGRPRRLTMRDLEMIEGSITFQHPILGVMVRDETLFQSDGRFSMRSASTVPLQQGLELKPSRLSDSITLSDDRRTLKLKLAGVGRRGDQVRVIVDAAIRRRPSRRPSHH
ncbi:FecR domain-containing protein [Rhodopirellula halodulae]|uniref:FecR domain-containing protein n=1 Tax=Rhodopirellula halodulae TaxID=2894198 RepID=UPI001E5C098A|nr:FecR domain-containing protein [Rhodopirellula sp. JC737]MCC9655356.1 FecR family protein [Rhodopirellula sp. JC737]